jgi:hypothetical protein
MNATSATPLTRLTVPRAVWLEGKPLTILETLPAASILAMLAVKPPV